MVRTAFERRGSATGGCGHERDLVAVGERLERVARDLLAVEGGHDVRVERDADRRPAAPSVAARTSAGCRRSESKQRTRTDGSGSASAFS
jgi:hypothetical protein